MFSNMEAMVSMLQQLGETMAETNRLLWLIINLQCFMLVVNSMIFILLSVLNLPRMRKKKPQRSTASTWNRMLEE